MANQCRYLEYRTEAKELEFDTARAYCTVADRFVQPMRADICNCRYDLDPEEDCEYYETAAEGSNNDGNGVYNR